MPNVLHILVHSDDAVARDTIARQKSDLQNRVEVADLTQAAPDYKALLEGIFAADSVAVW